MRTKPFKIVGACIGLAALLLQCKSPEPIEEPAFAATEICKDTCCEKDTGTAVVSRITCPDCKYSKTEILPTEVCLIKYTCQNCKKDLYPKEGDCCVFCTYGDVKCPSKQ